MVFQKVKEKQYPTLEWKEAKQQVIGTLIEVKGDLGVKKSTLYILKLDSTEEVGIWGTTVLDRKMHNAKVRDLIKITYLGKEKGKGIGAYHNFEVEIDDGLIEEELEVKTENVEPSEENEEEQQIEEPIVA